MTGTRSTRNQLLEGAREQFSRHGFVKTAMADIAEAAGVSRTSLYKHFSSKEDIFKALSERLNERVYDAVMAAFSADGAWDQRLFDAINARVSWVYALLNESEYGREMINEKNRICGGTILAANDRFQALVAELLADQVHDDSRANMLATVLIQSVNGVLENAETSEEAEARVTVLVEIFCAGLTAS
tara:strand:- start:3351 stop:3911 length:561 start_codon:yes stop_codon:yes gene_type:complete